MLRQSVTEDKQRKVEDVFVGTDGRPITRERLEDPGHKGFTRPAAIFTGDEIRAAAYYGLSSPSGRPFTSLLPVPQTSDPNIVTADAASPALREAVAVAEKEFSQAERAMASLVEQLGELEVRRRRAIAEHDKGAYDKIVSEEIELRAAIKEADVGLSLPRARYARASEALHDWIRRESNERAQSASRPGVQSTSAGVF